jgi:hypothetical protein
MKKGKVKKYFLPARLILIYREAMKIMIGFRVSEQFKKFLEKLADEENRTLSSFLYNAVLYYIKKEKGIDWKKQESKAKK